MKATVKRQKAITGFLPTTYAVFAGERLIKLFVSKIDAEKCAASWNNAHEEYQA